MDAMRIVAATHKDVGNGWCACGETVNACWWLSIYFPYLSQGVEHMWERLLNG
jgi:hypothetical protein